jgi:uncharacterized membrane protein YeaQ/YmgE (transglycosylase-associated protein family)
MTLFAELYLAPGGIVSWLFVGLIAGFFAGRAMEGSGFGMLGNILLGVVGAFVGGLLFGSFTEGVTQFWGSVAVSFIGACLLIGLVHLVAPRRTPTSRW